jgi:SAM-dependent methyltransferase
MAVMFASSTVVTDRMCSVCGGTQLFRVVERFSGGRFLECRSCGIHFAETKDSDLRAYYHDIWTQDNLGCLPYTEKIQAARTPALLSDMLGNLPRFRWALAQLKRLPINSKVLDVGCGEGALLSAAARLGLEPHGCDLAAPAVELARQLVGTKEIHVGTISDVPYEPATFDCVLALEVLEHLPNPVPFLESTARLMKHDGTLLLTTPNRYRLFAILKRFLGMPHSGTDYPPHHYTRWSAGSLRGLLERYFCETRVGSLPYQSHGPAMRAVAVSLHVMGGFKMGQTLCARAVGASVVSQS